MIFLSHFCKTLYTKSLHMMRGVVKMQQHASHATIFALREMNESYSKKRITISKKRNL